MADVNISLPQGFAGSVQITFAPDITEPTLTAETADAVKWPSKVEELLGRYEQHEPSYPHREFADDMVELGYTAYPPKKRGGDGESSKTYIRWTHKGSKRRVSMYQDTQGLTVDSKPVFDFVSTLPGAEVVEGKHHKVNFLHEHSVKGVLAAAEALRDYSNDG